MEGKKLIIFLLAWGMACSAHAAAQLEDSAVLYMPDGQLPSHPVRININRNLTRSMHPCLRLLRANRLDAPLLERPSDCIAPNFIPIELASNSRWDHPVEGITVPKDGTLLIFNLASFDFSWWQTGERVTPVLYWVENDGESSETLYNRKALGRQIYLGNGWGAVLWTVGTLGATLLILWLLVKQREKHSPFGTPLYVATSDGRLSLPLVQMALWTLAVGGVVLGFGLVSLEVSEIPETLVALMGFSAATGLIGHWQVKRDPDQALTRGLQPDAASSASDDRRPCGFLSDLVCIRTADGKWIPSLAKAQMLFWTVLTIGLFLLKSIQEGILWEVSEQLVLLMGISQASFLGREQLELARKEERNKAPESSTILAK